MKNIRFKTIFALVILLNIFLGCKPNKNLQGPYTPEVINPTYSIYNIKGERGYNVSFTLSKENPKPIAIVLNNIKQGILAENINGKKINVNVISQTKINNYEIKTAEKTPNGVVFNIKGTFYLKPVDFKLIEEK